MLAIDRQQLRSSLALSQHGGSNHGLVTDLIEAQAVIVLGQVDDAVRLLSMRFGGGCQKARTFDSGNQRARDVTEQTRLAFPDKKESPSLSVVHGPYLGGFQDSPI